MVYASAFAGGGVAAGIRLGIMLEILAIGARMMMYAVQPSPPNSSFIGASAA